MSDFTYDKDEINSDPVWKLAFQISEMENINAPIGWTRYIGRAKEIIEHKDEITEFFIESDRADEIQDEYDRERKP